MAGASAEVPTCPEVTLSAAAHRFFARKADELRRKTESHGQPNASQTAKLLRSLAASVRSTLEWSDCVRVNLRHPDIAVRKIDRAFTSLSWNFEANVPLKKTAPDAAKTARPGRRSNGKRQAVNASVPRNSPPRITKIIDVVETLARFFKDEYPTWLLQSTEGRALVRKNAETRAHSLNPAQPPEPPASVTSKARCSQGEVVSAEKRPPFLVHGSKKGGFPVTKEKRNRGKVVTIIRRVTGDQQLLLKEMKQRLGCGGKLVPTAGAVDADAFDVEIQGDSQDRVRRFLTARGCLKGVSGRNRALAEQKSKQSKGEKTKGTKTAVGDGPKAVVLTMDVQKIKQMKPSQLKQQLKARALSTQGNKKELLKRLLEFSIA
jgi:translation initiation factor 1 (eIF-1/SUI1)